MAENKTHRNGKSVDTFLGSVENDRKRADSKTLLEMMRRITGEEPRMWGDSIIGFGSQHYTYKSGREGDWFITGFSPRKQNISVYLSYGFGEWDDLLNRLGKHKTGKACLYINKLDDIDSNVLEDLIRRTVEEGVRFGE
ncbi:MAG: DUF1801 domain-containing protein [Spirochaetota bacterium]